MRTFGAGTPSSGSVPESRSVGFGIIGCGGIGRWHARIIRSLQGLELMAVADENPESRRRASADFGVPELTTDELLSLSEIEVVSICAPPHAHVPLIEAVATAGKHALVEKPLALDLPEADRIVSLCEERGVHLGVVHQQRARASSRTLRELIRTSALGRPVLATVFHTWFRTSPSEDGWRGVRELGGDVLVDQAIHAVDLLLWFLGLPRWVSGWTVDEGKEDAAVALLGFEGGALATLAASSGVNRKRDDTVIELVGTRGWFRLEVRDYDHVEITGLELARSERKRAKALSNERIEALVREHGGGWREGPRSPLWRFLAFVSGRERGAHPFRSVRGFLRRGADRVAQRERSELEGHAAILAQMGRAARGKGAPLVTGREARLSVAVTEAVYRSRAADGRRIHLENG